MRTLRQILCPVDFSDASAHAVEQAIAIARWFGARITALHVDSLQAQAAVFTPLEVPVPSPALPDRSHLRARLDEFFAAAPAAGVAVDSIVASGQPATAILDCAASLPADVIVIGTHGVSGFQHLVLGSVTEKVLRRASCPVLTVPPRAHTSSRLPFARLVCAVDFSDASIEAVRLASSLADGAGAHLALVHVVEWPWHEPPAPRMEDLPPAQATALAEYRRYLETTATTQLASLASSEAGQVVAPVVRVRHGKPYEQILAVAREDEADLIVLGVHGRTALDLGVFGSTTNQLVRHATCPVLTVRG